MRLQALAPLICIALELLLSSCSPIHNSEIATSSLFPRTGESDSVNPARVRGSRKPRLTEEQRKANRKAIAHRSRDRKRASIRKAEAQKTPLTDEQRREKASWDKEKADRKRSHDSDNALTGLPRAPRGPKGSSSTYVADAKKWELQTKRVKSAKAKSGLISACEDKALKQRQEKIERDRTYREKKSVAIAAAQGEVAANEGAAAILIQLAGA